MEVKHNALVFLHTPFWTVMETFFGQCEFGPRDYKWKNILNWIFNALLKTNKSYTQQNILFLF